MAPRSWPVERAPITAVRTPRDRYDAVVVGLGAAGCWAAKVLTERGLRVAALEAGPLLDDGDLPRDLPAAGLIARISPFRNRVQFRSVSYHPRLRHLYVDDRRHPYVTRGGDPFLWIRGRQVGGRLHIWARMSLRLSERDFSRPGPAGRPWPITYADLAPWYDAVETSHGLRGARDGLAHLPDGRITEPTRLSPWSELFRRRVEDRWPERRVVPPRVLVQGIAPVPAPLRDAWHTGRLDLIPEAPVARLCLSRTGVATGVEFVDTCERRTRELRADRVFLCASTLESVRILWNSRSPRHPAGVGNNKDVLGRYVIDHNFVVGSGPTTPDYRELMPEPLARSSSPLDLAADLDFYVPDFADTLCGRDFERGFGIQGRIFPDQWGMGAFGEMLPHPDNRVTLARKSDALGIPTVHIRVRRRENDRRMIEAERRELAAIAETAGLPVRLPLPGLLRAPLWRAVGPRVGVMHLGIAIHESGGARMGDDPRTSVVDPENRVWDCPNVHVTDGACLPSTGCQNPTLTIMALTARACALATG